MEREIPGATNRFAHTHGVAGVVGSDADSSGFRVQGSEVSKVWDAGLWRAYKTGSAHAGDAAARAFNVEGSDVRVVHGEWSSCHAISGRGD